MSPLDKNLYKDVIKSFFLAFKRLSLYSFDHPSSQDILNNLYRIFESILQENGKILILCSIKEGELVINEEPLSPQTMGVAELFSRFKALGMDGVLMSVGLSRDELARFIQVMAKTSVQEAGQAADVPELLRSGSEHITVKKIHYEQVEEGQTVVSAQQVVSGAPRVSDEGVSVAPVEFLFKDFLTGKSDTVGRAAADLLVDLDHSADKVAQAILDSAKECGSLEASIRKFVAWIRENLVPAIVDKKRDPSRFIDKLFGSFDKDDLSSHFAHPEELISSCADDIKLAMIEEAWHMRPSSPKRAVSLAAKILNDEEDQKRLLPRLGAWLLGRGAQAADAEAFVKEIEEELARDEDVPISKKKLHKLMKLSDRFEEEVGRRVREETDALCRENQRLSDDRERMEGIMRFLSDGLVVVDKSGKVVMMNPAAERLLGQQSKDSVGKVLSQGLREEHVLAIAKNPGVVDEAGQVTKEIELNIKDETAKRVLKAQSAVVENENGVTVGMVSVLRDITREKEVEELKTHFVSLVTHELRTPVVAVQKSLELILSKVTGALSEDQERFLNISKMNLDRLNNLINDLLDMSRLEAGKLNLRLTEFDMRDIIADVKAQLSGWVNDKQIDFKAQMGEAPVVVVADRSRMVQVLVNLVGNALKFTPQKGQVSVAVATLSSKEGVSAGPCVEVTVTDTGIGIDPKDFKRIFNKFEQVSLVAPSGTTGTGLGLPIAKEIIHIHGGKIWVESQKSKGSRFIFVIPRTPPPKSEESLPAV